MSKPVDLKNGYHPKDRSPLFPDKEPDYDNQGMIPAILAVSTILTALSFVAVVIRCYSRQMYAKFATEDGFTVVAWLLSFLVTFCVCWMTRQGQGKDTWNVSPEELKWASKFPSVITVASLSHIAAVSLIKISLLVFYIRLFPFGNFRRVCQAAIGFMAASAIALLLAQIFGCNPIYAQWTFPKDPSWKCIRFDILFDVGAYILVVGDVITLTLPLLPLHRSNMGWKKKLEAGSVFAVGVIATVSCIVRAFFMYQTTRVPNRHKSIASVNFTAMIEAHLGLICSCAPAVRVFLAHKFNWFTLTPAVVSEITPNRVRDSSMSKGTSVELSSQARETSSGLSKYNALGSREHIVADAR